MGQILLEDKIGTLSHSSGVISLTASRLTIGGQQYNTSALSRTISADVTMAANTRYQIFAVVSGGSVSLRISANENSAGPSGFSIWKLVGSFYANGMSLVAFGSFVTIEGSPDSNWISFSATNLVVNSGTEPTTNKDLWFKRSGPNMYVKGQVTFTNTPAAFTGLFLPLPGGVTRLNSYYPMGEIITYSPTTRTKGTVTNSTPAATQVAFEADIISGSTVRNDWITNISPWSWANGDYISFKAEIQVSSWSNTPIKDL